LVKWRGMGLNIQKKPIREKRIWIARNRTKTDGTFRKEAKRKLTKINTSRELMAPEDYNVVNPKRNTSPKEKKRRNRDVDNAGVSIKRVKKT